MVGYESIDEIINSDAVSPASSHRRVEVTESNKVEILDSARPFNS